MFGINGIKKFGMWTLGMGPYKSLPTFKQTLGRFFFRASLICGLLGGPLAVTTRPVMENPTFRCAAADCSVWDVDIRGKNLGFKRENKVTVDGNSGMKLLGKQLVDADHAVIRVNVMEAKPGKWECSIGEKRFVLKLDESKQENGPKDENKSSPIGNIM